MGAILNRSRRTHSIITSRASPVTRMRGGCMVPTGATRVRVVTHLDVDGAAIERMIDLIRAFCEEKRQNAS
jgi:hypothetical protein